MDLSWQEFDLDSLDLALSRSFCLYAFHHMQDGDRPFYIGKAKYFGTQQADRYEAAARYNSGYIHLVAGLLRSGFSLYIAEIGEAAFADVEAFEQTLIEVWNPIRPQKRTSVKKPVDTRKPWNGADSESRN
jgi:hypothetical protein